MANLNATLLALGLHARTVTLAYLKLGNRFGFFTGSTPAMGIRFINWMYLVAKLVVNLSVFTACGKLKVLNSVVQLVAVFVMNKLIVFKMPTQKAFHDKPVFSYLSALNHENLIAIPYPPVAWKEIYERVAVTLPASVVHVAKATADMWFPAVRNYADFHEVMIAQNIYQSQHITSS